MMAAGGGLTWLIASLCLACVAKTVAAPANLTMEVGQTKVISHASVARVAVGNGQVVSAVSVDGREVVLFARQEGGSSVHVWGENGVSAAYEVQVRPAGWAQLHREVQTLLSHIPSVRSSIVGDNIVIEGEDLGDDDRERVAALVRRFPRIVDFTGQVGWDRMVLLDVQVVELPSIHLRDFGVHWDAMSQGGLQTGVFWQPGGQAQLAAGAAPSPLTSAGATVGGYFGMNALLSSRIAALAQQGEAVMLAQPQLLARSGATASFLAGGEVPYTTTDANGRSHTQFKPYGVSLNITPRIDRNGAIRSRIEVEASSVDMSLSVAGGPALRTRRATTEFNVRSGQTLVIGGFLSRERSNEKKGVPVLQDIPGLGSLFSAQRERHSETELAIFVTPRIVSQDHPELAQRVQQGRDVLDSAFPEPTRLGTATPRNDDAGDWSMDRGPGSQWQPLHDAPPGE
ncbi:type II and III secretion system protein family protein [Bordetella sp. 02P26C-1]|uniref:type II and III secretion system protein family protein n=1 Tax=Bordetella sp. 02P26C-1 TaxID=2683195 RepID=UPI0013553C7D|nr:pilus assembly protein N-terminal domain-containing protein [Bordetella sp. 02P26C-1]MVW78829.1 secretion protein [Bordetella sp. 02P26C-1]